MTDTKSNFAQPFVGLSPNLKFVTNVANGSVWVDADTSIIYLYNLSDNTWYAYTQKVAVDELGTNISDNSNTQLKITPYESAGGEYKQDLTTGAFTIIDYAHHEIHSGSFYRAGFQKDVANAGTAILAITTPDTTTWAHFRPQVDGETEFNVMLYENPTSITGGTTVTPRNTNRNSSNSSVMTVVSDPTTDLTGATVIGNTVIGSNKSSGGATAAENEWILKQGTIYVMIVTNQTSSANEINIRWSWYEHTNRT